MDAFSANKGALFAEGVALDSLADAVGTPVYVYSAGKLRERYRALSGAIGGQAALAGALFAFAVKSNPNLSVLRVLAAEG